MTNPKAGQPDMVEVVAWLVGEEITTSEIMARRFLNNEPLVRLSDYQALQSQLEAAERERDEWRRFAENEGKDVRYFSKAMSAQKRAETAERERDTMREALKKIGNSPQSSWQALAEHYEAIAEDALQPQDGKP